MDFPVGRTCHAWWVKKLAISSGEQQLELWTRIFEFEDITKHLMTGLEINRELHGGDVQDFPAARACTLEVTSFNIQSWVNINTCTCKQTNRPQKNKIEGYSTNVCSLPAGPGGPGMPSLPSRPKRNSMQSIYNSRLRAAFFFFFYI